MADSTNKILGALSYFVGMFCALMGIFGLGGVLITGLMFLLSKNKQVKFHSLQASILILTFFSISILLLGISIAVGIIGVIAKIPFLSLFISLIGLGITLLAVLLYLFLAYKAFMGEVFKLPLIGNLAEKFSK